MPLRTFYTIIKSKVDCSWKIIGWTENPYIAISYFREDKQMDKDAQMFIIECGTILELYKTVQMDYDISMEDFLEARLMTRTSKDDRCYVIYKEQYNALFSDNYIHGDDARFNICDAISRVFLGPVTLLKYISTDNGSELTDLLYAVLFSAYVHTSSKRMSKLPNDSSIGTVDIDVVYFWRFVNAVSAMHGDMISLSECMYRPYDSVFIDSN